MNSFLKVFGRNFLRVSRLLNAHEQQLNIRSTSFQKVANPGLAVTKGDVVADITEESNQAIKHVVNCVNTQIVEKSHGRLFAVISIQSKQFKVTAEDIIVVQIAMPVDIGDKIVLEKVLMVGGRDFTIFGRPLLEKDSVRVSATVIEKTLSHESRNFICERRSSFHRSYFFRYPYTMLRITNVEILRPLEP